MDNPLKFIFSRKDSSKGLCSEESIKKYWEFLNNSDICQEIKAKTINELTEKFKSNRLISEYFSKIDNKSIYLLLFELYLQSGSNEKQLRTSIINLLNELRINIDTTKDIYEYIFQKIASLYREEEETSPESLNNYLTLLNALLGDTVNHLKPRNYFSCLEKGKFEVDLSNEKIDMKNCLTFIINFRINTSLLSSEECDKLPLTSLLKIYLSNGEYLSLDLKYPCFLIAKDIKDTFFKTLPIDEWINLIFNLENHDGKLAIRVFVNGENNRTSYKVPKRKIKPTEEIDSIVFFENFYGEVTSMTMLAQPPKEKSYILSPAFLCGFKDFQKGVWKREIFIKFMEFISGDNPKIKEKKEKIQNMLEKDTIKNYKESFEKIGKDLSHDLVFIFTPFNYLDSYRGIIENSIKGNIYCSFNESIKNHRYVGYQNKIFNLGIIPNIIPIAELFLIHPQTLTENNFEVFLNIIVNIINFRKKNINSVKEYKLFQILSLFIEKYPKQFFTEKVLDNFNNIGKTIFSNNIEGLSKSYFNHIFLNEKILSKYSENLQIKFWNQLLLFCQSDKEQIQTFIQMNRICLILRFYDKNKYTEMCCEKHLNMIKEEYVGNKNIMNPSMDKILSNLQNILNVIIDAQEPESAISLYKLLALDLSPCLTKFILNIFINALQRPNKDVIWKDNIIDQLIKCKFETISINTFVHSLPEIRFEILRLMYEIYNRLLLTKKLEYFTTFEKMIKTCLLPQQMFYSLDEKKQIIIKDEIFEDYKQKIFENFFCWVLGVKTDIPLSGLNLNKSVIKNINILNIIFILEKNINEPTFTFKFLKTMEPLITDYKNAINLLSNKKIFANFLDIAFTNYKTSNSQRNACGNLAKDILLNIFSNSLIALEKKGTLFPCYELETIFIWGDHVLILNNPDQKSNNLNEFLYKILFDFKKKYENNMKINLKINDNDTNFYLRNYLMLITQIYRFSFHFIYDLKFNNYGDTFHTSFSLKKNMLEKYLGAMRINSNEKAKNTISEKWLDYTFFNEIYKKLSILFPIKKIYNKYNIKKNKEGNNKLEKYTEVLNKIILDKNAKNVYKSELELLCYEEISDGTETITALIKEIPLFMMSILSLAKNFEDSNNEKEFLYWLKEYKHFILFVIIASSNLTRTNQLEFYNLIQDKCIGPILTSICFLKDLFNTTLICKEKALKAYQSILLICFLITKYQYGYVIKHSTGIKKFNFSSKPARNDLKESSIYIIFTELIKDKKGERALSLKKLEELENNKYKGIEKVLEGSEYNEALFDNQIIKQKLNEIFFTLYSYKSVVDSRNNSLSLLGDAINERYKIDILHLLPLYEKELMKYSNNSLEKNIKKKNKYKSIKKYVFSWNGLWSDRKLFFENIDLLKTKIKNHYTKTLMKPIIIPILDISYYLPEFSNFKPEKLFLPTDKKYYHLTMDMDKILKSEQNQVNISNNTKNENITENYLRSIYNISNPKLAESLLKISNNLDFGKEEEFTELPEDNKDSPVKRNTIVKNNNILQLFLCCLVKTSHHIKGVCFLDEKKLNFKVFLDQKTGNAMNGVELGFTTEDDDYDQDRHTCFGSYFVCHPKDKDLYRITIKYTDIKWIFCRRYYYKNSAIEIFTTTNKSFYLNFKYEKDRETIINNIISKFISPSKIIDDLKDSSNKNPLENVIGYENSSPSITKDNKKQNLIIKLSRKIELWRDWEITNFEFLMWLNIYGNRSYNDISQYPVFPWILSNYEDPLANGEMVILDKYENDKTLCDFNYRDLSLPMGMLELNDEGIKRRELFLDTYELLVNEKEEQEITPYIYGSNYSNPVYVCTYLIRLFPFTHISIELQGRGFDDPNRLFFSVSHSFYNSSTQKTDVRELIPEFFYLPEIFLNINELDMGVKDDGVKINDVLTPCEGNPYDFVMTMKTALENNQISYTINNWIDLIFGYKARGKDAENAKNIFTEASYQENIDINKFENKEAYLRMVEFGLIPNQIMNKECPKREKKENINKRKEIMDHSADLYRSYCLSNIEYNNTSNKFKDKGKKEIVTVLKMGSFVEEKVIIVQSNDLILEKNISFNSHDKDFKAEIINRIDISDNYNFMSNLPKVNSSDKLIKLLNLKKCVIIGGFYDGKILICETDSKLGGLGIYPFNDGSPVLSIESNKDEKFIFVGNSCGNVLVYEISDIGKWIPIYLKTEQISSISHINCNDQLNIWISASIDGYICIYTLPLCKLIRCIKVPTKCCSYAFLSDSPLPCIIVISDEENNSEIFVYSINGKLICKKQEYINISNPVIIKDLNSNDYLVYIGKDNVYIRNIPSLTTVVTLDSLTDIYSLCVTQDSKTLYTINKNGVEVTIIKEESNKKNLRNPSFIKIEK